MTNKTYFQLYSSDPILAGLYENIKSHKPEKKANSFRSLLQ